MRYRNGTYVAFDGGGDSNPTTGDIKYYNLMKAWKKSDNTNFTFIDSHDKTRNVRDGSLDETIKRVLRERMNNSKKMLLIISSSTRKYNNFLNYEIELAIEMEIPIKVCKVNGIESNEPSKLPYIYSAIDGFKQKEIEWFLND